jgi:hypothetical protein
MYKIPKDKAALHVLISKEVLKKFRELVRMKHDSLRGTLSYEVEQALAHWLLEHARANSRDMTATTDNRRPRTVPPSHVSGLQLEVRKFNPPIRYLKVWLEVKKYLEEKLLYDFAKYRQVHINDLKTAIGAVRGDERRTLNRWLETFERYGILKRISPKFYEVVAT